MDSDTLLEELNALITRAIQIDFQVSEETGRISLAADYVPGTLEMLRAGTRLLRQVHEHYEEQHVQPSAGGGDSLSEIGALISTEMAVREIADLAFLARGELKSCLQELEQARDQNDILQMASHCDTGLRRLRKALVSVESAMYEFEGGEAPVRKWFDINLSLDIRQAYSRLRRRILEVTPTDETLDQNFADVEQGFAELRGFKIYPLLRIDDRVQMRALNKRISQWRSGQPLDLQAGHRLWQDLTGFAELLAAVSHRQELREHDRRLIARANHALHRGRGNGDVPPALLKELRQLEGLDQEVDHLLHPKLETSSEAWSDPLKRLFEAMNPSGPF
jgi:hypothetical protein